MGRVAYGIACPYLAWLGRVEYEASCEDKEVVVKHSIS
jgi:hypothetical protein